jgi:5'(3')-deoxyribonucleotidase
MTNVSDTINKWVKDGMTREEAIIKYQSITPYVIRSFIKDERYDFIREINLDEEMLDNLKVRK